MDSTFLERDSGTTISCLFVYVDAPGAMCCQWRWTLKHDNLILLFCAHLPLPLRGVRWMPQVRRGKGDNLEFSKFCKELLETKLADVVHRTNLDNVGEPVAAA